MTKRLKLGSLITVAAAYTTAVTLNHGPQKHATVFLALTLVLHIDFRNFFVKL